MRSRELFKWSNKSNAEYNKNLLDNKLYSYYCLQIFVMTI